MATTVPDRSVRCLVELSNEKQWLRIAFTAGAPFEGGSLVTFASDAHFYIEPTDANAASYQRSNWLSGVISGARYAFRCLEVPRQHLQLTELAGRFGSNDMGALANAAVIAVARLFGKDAPQLDLAGWSVAPTSLANGTKV